LYLFKYCLFYIVFSGQIQDCNNLVKLSMYSYPGRITAKPTLGKETGLILFFEFACWWLIIIFAIGISDGSDTLLKRLLEFSGSLFSFG